MHSDKPTGTSVRQVLRVVPFAIFRRYSFPLSSTKDANKVTRTSSNHLECEKKKGKKPHSHMDRQLMFLQCRQLWVIPIQQQQEVKTSQGDPLLFLTIGFISLLLLMSNNSSHGRSKNRHLFCCLLPSASLSISMQPQS